MYKIYEDEQARGICDKKKHFFFNTKENLAKCLEGIRWLMACVNDEYYASYLDGLVDLEEESGEELAEWFTSRGEEGLADLSELLEEFARAMKGATR